MWRLTEDPESVVEGDDDDSAERGEDPGVVEGGGAPGPGLAVYEHQHRQLWVVMCSFRGPWLQTFV